MSSRDAPTPEPEARGAEVVWYWCPSCALVAAHPGACAGCREPMYQAPPWGIPHGPYRPPPRDIGPAASRVAMAVVSVFVIGVVGGIWLLARSGNTLDERKGGRRGSGTTTFAVPSLTANLDLPGSWVTDFAVAEDLRQTVLPLAEGNIRTEVTARKGLAFVAIVSAPVSDPATILERNVSEEPQLQRDEDGNAITISASERLKIAEHDAVVTDIQGRRATGEPVFHRRLYVIDASDTIVFIEVLGAPEDADREFPGIEQALLALQ